MITEVEALELAEEVRLKLGKFAHNLVSADFVPARDKPFRSEAVWVVRYLKPQPNESVIDDGDMLFVVKIDPETKRIKVSDPL
jgi:hypothetical protein